MTKMILGRLQEKCPRCKGTGIISQHKIMYPYSKYTSDNFGNTQVETEVAEVILKIKCEYCGGTGYIDDDLLLGDDSGARHKRLRGKNSDGTK